MKLKRQPEDFRVEELPLVEGGDRGRFGFYRLTKRGVGTLEAIEAIRRRWNLSGQQISYGGLKDRHAVTIQYLTILDGPDQGLREAGSTSSRSAGSPHPYGPNAVPGQPVHRRPPRPVAREGRGRAGRARRAAPRRPAQLLRRPAVRLGRLRRRLHRPGLAGRATTRRPSAWPSPSPTPPTGPTRRPRRRSSARPGATGPRPRPGSPGRTPGAW